MLSASQSSFRTGGSAPFTPTRNIEVWMNNGLEQKPSQKDQNAPQGEHSSTTY